MGCALARVIKDLEELQDKVSENVLSKVGLQDWIQEKINTYQKMKANIEPPLCRGDKVEIERAINKAAELYNINVLKCRISQSYQFVAVLVDSNYTQDNYDEFVFSVSSYLNGCCTEDFEWFDEYECDVSYSEYCADYIITADKSDYATCIAVTTNRGD